MIALDTESTGLDLRHGAKPFLVTTCDDDDNVTYFEWDVDPLTRRPQVVKDDLIKIEQLVDEADEVVFQNPKYDVKGLHAVGLDGEWNWDKTYDTLMAGHLLRSDQPHDLTSMALLTLGVNVKSFEDAVKRATEEARTVVKREFPDWRIAKKGLPEMPSAKEKVWKNDMWLPRALVKEAVFSGRFDLLPDHDQQPSTGVIEDCNVRIDRRTKWGNPFRIGKDGTREEVVKLYAQRIWGTQLIDDLPQLYKQRLGCHCYPRLCHGDVLRALCHPWMTVCSEYANSDSCVTLALFRRQRELLIEKGLWKIYQERLKVLPVVYQMENRGVTLNGNRLTELYARLTVESDKEHKICVNLSNEKVTKLPVNGVSNELKNFIFGTKETCSECSGSGKYQEGQRVVTKGKESPVCAKCFGQGSVATGGGNLNLISNKKTPKGAPSMDKDVLDHWLATLPEKSRARRFIQGLRKYRKRKTAIGFLDSYQKFWLPIHATVGNTSKRVSSQQPWRVLYSSLNPTGTNTLRFSSSNPNQQQISKQEEVNLRYCFGPASGREWWSLDAKNIELRLPAYEAGETEMIDLFERPDEPPYFGSNHLLMFSVLHPEKWDHDDSEGLLKAKKRYASTWYSWTKNGNFAIQYGAVEQSGTADRAYHVPGAQKKIQGRFKKIARLNQKMIDMANKVGHVETILDKTVDSVRGYPLYCMRGRWGKVKATIPLSYHVQGSASWWMMKGMVRCQAYLDKLNSVSKLIYAMVMQVHDELVFDFPRPPHGASPTKHPREYNLPHVRRLQRLMEEGGNDFGIPTPVGIEYHENNWAEGVEI